MTTGHVVRIGKTPLLARDEKTGKVTIKPRGRRLSVSEIIRQKNSKRVRVVSRKAST